MTILAGRNGSGKSAIIEVLASFDLVQMSQKPDAKPISGESPYEYSFKLSLDQADLDAISSTFDWAVPSKLMAKFRRDGILYTVNNEYLSLDPVDGLPDNHRTERAAMAREFRDVTGEIPKSLKPRASDKLPAYFDWEPYSKYLRHLTDNIQKADSGDERKEAVAIARRLKGFYDKANAARPFSQLHTALQGRAPKVLFLQDIDLDGRWEIEASEVRKDALVSALLRAINQSAESLEAHDKLTRRQLLSQASDWMTERLGKYLPSGGFEFRIELDGGSFIYGLIKGGIWYTGTKVSEGVRRFLSIAAQLPDPAAPSALILIDEPGNLLHPDAQVELRELLAAVAGRHQVIYSTHSPYLIPPDDILAVRLCINSDSGTVVTNKFYSSARGKAEGITPIFDAIGFSLDRSFAPIGELNIIVEGIVDYVYLSALLSVVEAEALAGVRLIPCLGVSRAQHIASVLEGWQLDWVILTDSDGAGREAHRQLGRSQQLVDGRLIEFVTAKPNQQVEDLISHEDFDRYALSTSTSKRKPGESNAVLLRRLKIDKVVAAQTFADGVRASGVVSEETKQNFLRIVQIAVRSRRASKKGSKTEG